MSKTPNYDTAVKKILDSLQPGERVCALTGEKWFMSEEEIGWYKKFNVPPSGYSPFSTWLFMAHYSTGYQWWWNKHFYSDKPILSFVHPSTGIKVLPDEEWFTKDFTENGFDYDNEVDFFAQFGKLVYVVPLPAFSTAVPPINSIALVSYGDQNSYFVLASQTKNSYYCVLCHDIENCSDCVSLVSSINCHNVLQSERMHGCNFVQGSFDCVNCHFCFDCRNCQDCFGSTNQRNKKYLWFNEQLSQEEWENRWSAVNLGRRDVQQEYLLKYQKILSNEAIWPANLIEGGENSTGDFLNDCVNCQKCFTVKKSTDNFWIAYTVKPAQSCAFSWGCSNASDCYFCLSPVNGNNCKFCNRSRGCDTCEYCYACYDCRDCFACVGLQKKKFCIFNKQYSEEEYWTRLDKLKTRMLDKGVYGKFFPFDFGTGCAQYGGLVTYTTKNLEDLKNFGGKIFPPCENNACGFENQNQKPVLSNESIPNDIADFSEEQFNYSYRDSENGRCFSFLKPEIEHYKGLNIAPPVRHFIVRIYELFRGFQLAEFENSQCVNCHQLVLTTKNTKYSNRKIYCRSCYLRYLEENN